MNYRLKRLSRCLPAIIFFCCSWFWALAQQPAVAPPDSIPHPDSLSDAELNAEVLRLSGYAKTYEAEWTAKTQRAASEAEAAGQALLAAQQDSTASKSSRDSLSGIAKRARKLEKDALKQQKQTSKTVEFAEKVSGMDAAMQRKNLTKCYKQVRESYLSLYPPPPAEKPVAEIIGVEAVAPPDSARTAKTTLPAATEEPNPEKRKTREKPVAPRFKPYDPGEDVMLHPPQRPCSLAVSTRDEFSGETYRESQREELFRFTNELMKKYLTPDQPHIICEAALSTGGSTISLHLTFSIRDNNARRTFGSLNRNSVVILKYIDGTTFSASNLRNDDGVLDPSGQVYSYRGQYTLDPSAMKKLRKTEIDKIRVSWSTGYEDYEVQNIDLLLRQAKCLFD